MTVCGLEGPELAAMLRLYQAVFTTSDMDSMVIVRLLSILTTHITTHNSSLVSSKHYSSLLSQIVQGKQYWQVNVMFMDLLKQFMLRLI